MYDPYMLCSGKQLYFFKGQHNEGKKIQDVSYSWMGGKENESQRNFFQ